jgi:ABC-type multidrug transport system fused ATPase/permease subunit
MYGHFAEAGTLAEEVLGSIRTVKAFGSERQLGERFAEVVEKARRIGRRLTLMESAALPILCEFRCADVCMSETGGGGRGRERQM